MRKKLFILLQTIAILYKFGGVLIEFAVKIRKSHSKNLFSKLTFSVKLSVLATFQSVVSFDSKITM